MLTDLKESVVLLGTQRRVCRRALPINDPTAARYTIDSIAAGQYGLAVKGVNRAVVERLVSAEVARLLH